MSDGRLLLGNRRYSSWSLRGWLPVRLARLDVEEVVIPFKADASAIAGRTPSDLVPYLEHRGARVWESLAICEYCAELEPGLWPEGPVARAHARSVAAEMHAGFKALRAAMPMNLGRDAPLAAVDGATRADIGRVSAIWREALAAYGGPFLFGTAFGNADAMFAPVVTRLLSYRVELAEAAQRYCAAVRAHPVVAAWYELAAKEPPEWQLARYEAVR